MSKIWVLCFFILPVALALEFPFEIVGPMLVFVLVMPSLVFLRFTNKWLQFLRIPTPIQLMKGYKQLWQVVKKGPVVTRVHLPQQQPPSSPTP
jgi:hypothetical protein